MMTIIFTALCVLLLVCFFRAIGKFTDKMNK